MQRIIQVVVLGLGLAWCGGVRADSINIVGSTGALQAFPGTFNTFGTPYWNNDSFDNQNGFTDGKASVGHYLTGTGNFVGGFMSNPGIAPADLQQFANGDSSADLNVKFTTSAVNVTTQLYITITANVATNVLGWYDSTGEYELFSGSNTAFFTPTGAFGLFLRTANDGTFYSESSLNTGPGGSAADPNQHFAVFRQSNGKIWVGVEDLMFSRSDRDYNDIIISLEAIEGSNIPTPEPASAVAFCVGGLLLGGYRLRQRRQQ